MSKYRKKYQNIVEKKNHLTYVPRDHNTIEHYESQALDGFTVEPSEPEFYMQRMGQLNIMSSGKRRYNLNVYSRQMRVLFPATRNRYPPRVQTLDNFIIKPKEKPKNAIQKPVHFNINHRPRPKNYIEEQIDSFICAEKPRPLYSYENVLNVMIEKEKKKFFKQTLNQVKLPATGRRFNNNPILKARGNIEMEYLKIKAPYKFVHSSKLLIPFKPKLTRFTNILPENNSNFNYIIKKTKKFSPASTMINHSSLLIPNQPKKTSFKEITTEKTSDLIFDISPKTKTYDYITIENFPDVYIPEQPKKRYYSVMNADNMSIAGSERPEFCLEIDPNEEIFIPNVYDMLLIQNYWDELSIRSFRICLRPKGYIGKSTQNVGNYNYNNILESIRSIPTEVIKENNEENEIETDRNKVKDFEIDEERKNKDEVEIDLTKNNIYERKESVNSLKADLEEKENEKENENENEKEKEKENTKTKKSSLKKSRFKDLKKKLMMLNDDEQ